MSLLEKTIATETPHRQKGLHVVICGGYMSTFKGPFERIRRLADIYFISVELISGKSRIKVG